MRRAPASELRADRGLSILRAPVPQRATPRASSSVRTGAAEPTRPIRDAHRVDVGRDLRSGAGRRRRGRIYFGTWHGEHGAARGWWTRRRAGAGHAFTERARA